MNVVAAENAIKEMIDAVLINTADRMPNILNTTASRVQQTIY